LEKRLIKINKIISTVIREYLSTVSSDARLGSISTQWELLLHPLGTCSVESLPQALGMLKFMRVQRAVKRSQGKKSMNKIGCDLSLRKSARLGEHSGEVLLQGNPALSLSPGSPFFPLLKAGCLVSWSIALTQYSHACSSAVHKY